MERTIISHDTKTALARIKFEHNGVTYEDDFNLKYVIPGSESILNEMGIEFTKKLQLTTIDKLTDKITKAIDEGIITNPPVTKTSEYTPPEEPASSE